MDGDQQPVTAEEQERFRKFCTGHAQGWFRPYRRLNRLMPHGPRCKLCHAPFAGFGGKLYGLTGFAPSRKNPAYCNR